jgi:N-acetylglucosamine-6-phosphate deacetylase
MAFNGICRIPGRNGFFQASADKGLLTRLEPVDQQPGAADLWLTPGLFDIQVNGMLGHNLSDEDLTADKVVEIERALERHGVTRWCPTVTTQDPKIVERNLEILGGVIAAGAAPNIHCIHLEGHYISAQDGYRGVHMARYVRDPDSAEFDRWQRAAGGHIGLFSLAPERAGALGFIAGLRARGVRVGLVHHNADHTTVRQAAAAGADLASHLVNGCAPMINRQHNVIWSQLALDELWASFIADGYHIPAYTLRAVIKAKGLKRSLLVSDLAHLSGLPDGEYDKMDRTVVLQNGGLWVKGEGTNLLSGAVKTLEQGCAYLAAQAGFSLEQALKLASLNPARYFGIESAFRLFPGRKGPLVVFALEQQELKVKEICK